MNAFSVLQDDVEDAADLTAAPPLRPGATDEEDAPTPPPAVARPAARSSGRGRGGPAGAGRGAGGRGGAGRGAGGGGGGGHHHQGGGAGHVGATHGSHATAGGKRSGDMADARHSAKLIGKRENIETSGSQDTEAGKRGSAPKGSADAQDTGAGTTSADGETTEAGEQTQDSGQSLSLDKKQPGGEQEEQVDAEEEEEEEQAMSLEEYLAKKAELAASVPSLSSAKGVRKANEGTKGSAFAKMSVLRKANPADDSKAADASSILSSVSIKEPPVAKGRKDSTQTAVLDNAKIQEFFKAPAAGTERGDRGSFRGRGGFRGGPRASGDARSANYANGRGGMPRDFRDSRQFHGRDAAGNYREPESSGGPGNAQESGTGYAPRGGAARGGGYMRGRGGGGHGYNGPSNPQANGAAPNVDDTTAFPSLG